MTFQQRHCMGCGRRTPDLWRFYFDADRDRRYCDPIVVCADCKTWYKSRRARVAAANRRAKEAQKVEAKARAHQFRR